MRTYRFVYRSLCLAMAAALLAAGCAGRPAPRRAAQPATAAASPATGLRTLTAVLFPYIPDAANDSFKALIGQLTQQFQNQHPEIQLQLMINPKQDLYDTATLQQLLGTGAGAVNVVELDTLLFGDLVKAGLITPLTVRDPDVLPVAQQAATVGHGVYGMPTYLCSNVIYCYSSDITAVGDATSLVAFLKNLNPGVRALAGNFHGSWTLPSEYVDAWGDSDGTSNLSQAYQLPLDNATMSVFPSVVQSCVTGQNGANPCLDGTYANGTGAETAFAGGQANGFFGYTERLFYILTSNPKTPSVISAPIGGGSHPVMFVDALAVNTHCTGQCLSDAEAFLAFMSSVATRNLIAFSQDAPAGTIPRYLLQANGRFYSSAPASRDSTYVALWQRVVQQAAPYPNSGFPAARKPLQKALCQVLDGPACL